MARPGDPYEPLSNSPFMRRLDSLVDRVAAAEVTVMITGESGVGKELVARTIHQRSSRGDRPFVKVNCAALPVGLLESELFGHERGAFTGADHRKRGKFEQAHTGTIFLDEISEMPPPLQAKLLHVLQDHEFARLGSERDIRVDVRVIAATNRDLEQYVAQRGFREDLYYRLNVVNIHVPALRERIEEIPILVEHFIALYSREHRREQTRVSEATLERLRRYSWPGNVRELQNVVQRLVVLGTEAVVSELLEPEGERAAAGETLSLHDSDVALRAESSSVGLKELARRAAEQAERLALARELERAHWHRGQAAQRLRISYKTLLDKIKHYELDRRGP